jgi:hypothetical protein
MKTLLTISLSILMFSVGFGQDFIEDMDFKFVTPKSAKDRKFHFFAQSSINMSTIWGQDARQYRQDIEDYRQSINIDIYTISIYPGIHFGLLPHYRLSENFSIYVGAQYHLYGWKEIARDRLNSANYFRYNLNNNFHYIAIPLGYAVKAGNTLTFRMDFQPMFLVGNSVVIRETFVSGGIKEKEKTKEDFETLYQVNSNKFLAMGRVGLDIRITDNIFFNLGASVTGAMMKEVDFKFAGGFAGITLKL